MAIPDYQSIMLPLLKYSSDKKEHTFHEAVHELTNQFKLTEEERKELLPSGQQEVFANRVGWARTYMKKAGLLSYPRRGYFKITERGLSVLAQKPDKITNKFLRQYPEFVAFQTTKRKTKEDNETEEEDTKTPEEEIEDAYLQVREGLVVELLETVKGSSPTSSRKRVPPSACLIKPS